jgi:general secretion pathway protein D
VLGYLFRSHETNRDKVNLMVFLHPVILRDIQRANSYTSEKYNIIRAEQLRAHPEDVPLLPGDMGPQLPRMNELLELPPPYQGISTSSPSSGAVTVGTDD